MTKFMDKLTAILCLLLLVAVLAGRQEGDFRADVPLDIGPKPWLAVSFRIDTDYEIYGTFVTDVVASDRATHIDIDEGILAKFQQLSKQKDADGLQVSMEFLRQIGDRSQLQSELYQGSMYPGRFKLLLYVPECDLWIKTTQIADRYDFYSKYVLDLRGLDLEANRGGTLIVDDRLGNYEGKDKIARLVDMAVRIVATFLIEWGIAVCFYKWRGKRNMFVILVTNLVTQTLFNIYCFHFRLGPWLFFTFPLGELAVFVVEAVVYCKLLKTDHDDWVTVTGYAFAANLVTAIATFLPGTYMDLFISETFY